MVLPVPANVAEPPELVVKAAKVLATVLLNVTFEATITVPAEIEIAFVPSTVCVLVEKV